MEKRQPTRQRAAHFLARVPGQVILNPIQLLPDGSYLALLQPSDYHRRQAGDHLRVRVIEYTIDDPARRVVIYRIAHRREVYR